MTARLEPGLTHLCLCLQTRTLLQAHSANCHTQEASLAFEHSGSELAFFQPRGNKRAMNKSALYWEQKKAALVRLLFSATPSHSWARQNKDSSKQEVGTHELQQPFPL